MKALVLSGGAAKGAYQAGVLQKWMGEDEIDYELVCGVSVGAINGGKICQYPMGKPRDAASGLLALWDRVSTDKIYKQWWPFGKWEAIWKQAAFDSSPLQEWIMSEVDPDVLVGSGRKLRVGAVAWDTAEYHFAHEGDADIAKWIIASSSFPIFLLPIDIQGQLWSDGGLRSVTPLGEAIRSGATEIDVIMCSNPDIPSTWSIKGQSAIPGFLMRCLSIMSDEIVRADLKVCGLKNDIAELGGPYKRIKIRLVQPKVELVKDSLVFDPDEIKHMIEVGYEDSADPIIL